MQNKNNFNKNRRQNNNGNGNRNQNFDSNGSTGRIKGSAKQISDKYQSMARDAYASGDNIAMESHYQHAEHYFRINNYINDQAEQKRKNREAHQNNEAKKAAPKVVAKVETVAKPAEKAIAKPVEVAKEEPKVEKVVKKTRRNATKKTKIGSKAEEQ